MSDFDLSTFKAELFSELRDIIKSETSSQLNGALKRFEREFPEKIKTDELQAKDLQTKSVETQLAELRQQLAATETARLNAVKSAAIAGYSAKAVNTKAWMTLFNSEYGDKLTVDEATGKVYVQDGESTHELETIAEKFNTQGTGALIMKVDAGRPAAETPPREKSGKVDAGMAGAPQKLSEAQMAQGLQGLL